MARGRKAAADSSGVKVADYRYDDTRKNIPPAKIAAEGRIPDVPKLHYSYSPRLDPVLRFDGSGKADQLPELLAAARQRPLSEEEAKLVAEALRRQEPWLEWAGKREAKGVEIDPVALHIHERVSAQAILKVAARQDVTRDLFADPQQSYREAVQFYQHDIDWTNRLILGDSLQVMASLAQREDLAGKVQMIYMDPPYGIRYGSNFQPKVGETRVAESENDLPREAEVVRAYRDTWHLGIHSYLTYMRARLVVARGLLSDTGSLFVQIGEENVHRIRALLEEIFGTSNYVSTIAYKTAIGMGSELLDGVHDYVIWFARDKEQIKFHPLFSELTVGGEGATRYKQVESTINGTRRLMSDEERDDPATLSSDWRPYRDQGLTSRSGSSTTVFEFNFAGGRYRPKTGGWRTNEVGLNRVAKADRILITGDNISYKKYFEDSPSLSLGNLWTDTGGGITSRSDPKVYAVQTSPLIIERCLLMTTDPGDLIVDPTCGGGTAALVAERWGRRWITIDTSRVAVSVARQRILTAKFDYFELLDEQKSTASGFRYKTVPHVTLRSIARNNNLDPIFAKHEPIMAERLRACTTALGSVSPEVRQKLQAKLLSKQRAEGKRSITEADTRRWTLPAAGGAFQHWTVPFDTDPAWPQALADAVTAYRAAWQAKMDEVNACIAANAEQEELVDQPIPKKGIVRVSGPFTVEAVQPPEVSLGDVIETPIGGEPEEIEDAFVGGSAGNATADGDSEAKNAEAYLDQMFRLLKIDGVRFPDNKQMSFTRIEPMSGRSTVIHAEGRWVPKGETDEDADGRATVAIAFGPQYGPVTAQQVEQLLRAAARRGYDDLVIAGFNFDGAAQAVIDDADHPDVRIHMAHIRPDVNPGMAGLLKEQPGSQLFTVFGQPRTTLAGPDKNSEYVVHMEGVDIYNPVENTVTPSRGDKVAAWFMDTDYDGRTFCITQAFFPNKSAWAQLSKALNGVVEEDAFEKLSGTESIPFPAGKHRAVAVKVIDPRGNEVMRVHRLEG